MHRPPLAATPALRRAVWNPLRCGVLAVGLALAALSATPVHAQDVPWRRAAFDLKADNEPLNIFLGRMLTLSGIGASMSPALASGRINGRFTGQADTIFREVSDTYGLMSYYDGVTLHVYSLAEAESRWLRMEPADIPRVQSTLRRMRLEDNRFPMRIDMQEGTIWVSGPPKYVEVVSEIATHVAQTPTDIKQSDLEVRVFPLRHARAIDTSVNIGGIETTIAGVTRVLSELLGADKGSTTAVTRQMPRQLDGVRGKGLIATPGSSARPSATATRSPVAYNAPQQAGAQQAAAAAATSALMSSIGGAASGSSEEETPLPSAALSGLVATQAQALHGAGPKMPPPASIVDVRPPESRRPAEVYVTADARTNAVIVRDRPERMAMYERLIRQLDVEMPLIDIEASVIDLSDDKSEELGIDWRLHGSRLDVSSSPGGLGGGGAPTYDGTPPQSAGNGLVGTLIFGNQRNYFLGRVNALAQNGDARVASNPRVLTLNNHEAVLQSTREFYVRVAGRDQVDLFPVSAGLTMRVTPTLVDLGGTRQFQLNVRIEDGVVGSAQVDQIPVVSRNAISTRATVGDGQSLLIGGYVIDERREGKNGVPGLSDLPGIGWLFGQRNKEARRVERIFMITPRFVSTTGQPPAAPAAPAGEERRSSAPDLPEALDSPLTRSLAETLPAAPAALPYAKAASRPASKTAAPTASTAAAPKPAASKPAQARPQPAATLAQAVVPAVVPIVPAAVLQQQQQQQQRKP